MVLPNDIDPLNPPAEIKKRRHKLKRLVQSPNSFFLDVRCLGSFNMFHQNMATYQNLITQSMYDKQLDSGRGTLLHSCDDVIQQEVGQTGYHYVLYFDGTGKLTGEELDLRCEELIKEEFGEACNFDVVDAVQKLEKLGIVSREEGTLRSVWETVKT